MAQREILLPWDSQPQEPVEVDWSNPLTQGLVFLAPLFGGQVHDIAGGKRATVTGTLGHGATVDGVFGLLSGTQYYDYADFGAELTNTTPATIAWMQTPIAGSAYSSIGTLRPSGSTGGFNIAYQHATASSYRFATGPVGSSAAVYWDNSGELGGMTNGRSDRFVLRTSSNLYTTTRSDWTLFRGQASWTGSSASNFGSVGGTNRIGRNGASDAPWDGTIGMLAVWNRALSNEEARGYNANPWQIFTPRSIWIPVSAGGPTPVGISSETDAALALSAAHIQAAGRADETDAALALPAVHAAPFGLATETNAAFALPAAHIQAIGLASETDTAIALSALHIAPVGLAAEADEAFELGTPAGGAVGRSDETDTALALEAVHAAPFGVATETSGALALPALHLLPVGMALEINVGFSLASLHRQDYGRADEVDAAFALGAGSPETPTYTVPSRTRIGATSAAGAQMRLGGAAAQGQGQRIGATTARATSRRIGDPTP